LSPFGTAKAVAFPFRGERGESRNHLENPTLAKTGLGCGTRHPSTPLRAGFYSRCPSRSWWSRRVGEPSGESQPSQNRARMGHPAPSLKTGKGANLICDDAKSGPSRRCRRAGNPESSLL